MYFNYHQQAPKNGQNTDSILKTLKQRIMDLQSENQKYRDALCELNECYSQKIEILQEQLQKYKAKYEQLLQQKKDRMDSTIGDTNRYQQEIQKVINITESLHACFEQEKQKMRGIIEEKQQQLAEMQERNQQDRNKVQALARKYIAEIGRLQSELKELRQQGSHTKEELSDNNFNQDEPYHDQNQTDQGNPLKDISNNQIKRILSGKKDMNSSEHITYPNTAAVN